MKTIITGKVTFPGWYTARQEGCHEDTVISWHCIGVNQKKPKVLGTSAKFFKSLQELENFIAKEN